MIRYAYSTQLQPPAPFVNVVLRNSSTGAELRDIPGQLDSAADRTVIPLALAESLALPQVDSIQLGGFGGATFTVPVFAVLLCIHDLPPTLLKVAAHPDETWVLLGRDIMNFHRAIHDGPRQALEIDR